MPKRDAGQPRSDAGAVMLDAGASDAGTGHGSSASDGSVASFDRSIVVTETLATDLLVGDVTPPVSQVRQAKVLAIEPASGQVERVAVPASGASSAVAADSTSPAISDDGTRVVFVSALALTADDSDSVGDIYLRDRANATTERISKPHP